MCRRSYENDSASDISLSLQKILPAGCSSAVENISAAELPEYTEEAVLSEGWGASRRGEFLAGRLCARRALFKLGVVAGPIGRTESALPIWPAGYIGSISHSRGICGAVVGAAVKHTCLGFDLERTDRLSDAASKKVIHPIEAFFATGDQRNSSLLFSAKEAFYKAQFSKWAQALNFQDVGFAVDFDSRCLRVTEIRSDLPDSLRKAAFAMRLRFAFTGSYVVTVCSV